MLCSIVWGIMTRSFCLGLGYRTHLSWSASHGSDEIQENQVTGGKIYSGSWFQSFKFRVDWLNKFWGYGEAEHCDTRRLWWRRLLTLWKSGSRQEEADDKILLHRNVSNVALPPTWSHFLQLYYFSVTHSGINQQWTDPLFRFIHWFHLLLNTMRLETKVVYT